MAQPSLRIVVLGAGYAGTLATARLAGRVRPDIQRGQVAITLVNAADVLVERLRLHQLAANRPIVQRPIADMLCGTGVSFMRGMVTGMDVARRTIAVQTDAGAEPLGYDQLVYALGSTIDQDSVPGVRTCVCLDAKWAAFGGCIARSCRDCRDQRSTHRYSARRRASANHNRT
jgi:NADH dehydrogenase FAD-containing subunit